VLDKYGFVYWPLVRAFLRHDGADLLHWKASELERLVSYLMENLVRFQRPSHDLHEPKLTLEFVTCNVQIDIPLEIQPQFRRCAKGLGQTERHLSGHRLPTVYQLIDCHT